MSARKVAEYSKTIIYITISFNCSKFQAESWPRILEVFDVLKESFDRISIIVAGINAISLKKRDCLLASPPNLAFKGINYNAAMLYAHPSSQNKVFPARKAKLNGLLKLNCSLQTLTKPANGSVHAIQGNILLNKTIVEYLCDPGAVLTVISRKLFETLNTAEDPIPLSRIDPP